MQVILLHDHYDRAHLEAVKAEMETLGAPTVKALYDAANDVWMALEGCHRIRAAHELGLTPEMVECDDDDMMIADLNLDWQSGDFDSTAAEAVENNLNNKYFDFED
jgi:hypothetical protein